MMVKKYKITKYLSIFSFLLLVLPLSVSYVAVSKTLKTDKEKTPYNESIEYYALIVGVGSYQEEIISPIYLDITAKNLYESLLDNGWKENNMRLLLNENATKSALLESFNWLDDNEDQNDIVLFYFGGHSANNLTLSYKEEGDFFDEYICPFDSKGTDRKNDVQDKELNKELNKLDSKNVVVILDTCHSSGFFETKKKQGKDEFISGFTEDIIEDSRTVIMSCKENQRTWQNSKGSIFGGYFVEALNTTYIDNVDKNNDENISAEEAFIYAKRKTIIFEFIDTIPKKSMLSLIIVNLFSYLSIKHTFIFFPIFFTLFRTLQTPCIFDANPDIEIPLVSFYSL